MNKQEWKKETMEQATELKETAMDLIIKFVKFVGLLPLTIIIILLAMLIKKK